MTITVPMYVSPPNLTENEHFFSFFVGFSACVHIVVIVSVTALTMFLNSPYTESETMIVRIETIPIYAAIMIGNYISMMNFIAALLIAGFNRSILDGALQTFVIILIICLLYSVTKIFEKGNNGFQLDRALEFFMDRGGPDNSQSDPWYQFEPELMTVVSGRTIELMTVVSVFS